MSILNIDTITKVTNMDKERRRENSSLQLDFIYHNILRGKIL